MMLLEEIFKSKKSEHTDQFNLRIHRGLSWLKKSIDLQDDLDLQFISLWVSFNAIYAQDLQIAQDKQSLRQFLYVICQKDAEHKIYNILWERFSQPIRLFLDNPYVYQGFWDYQNQKISHDACKEGLAHEKQKVLHALKEKDSVDILMVLFNRMYTLRNQMVHGGATYKSSVNRKQLQDGCTILLALLPVFMVILLENAETLDLGKPFYPVVQVS
ncbi:MULTISPECIES: HEPN domain-containing protein [Acinetobacter]|uniref:HEPN domain-containing protein n=1 Tax=Acinetobacter TaxID=469 RepID=UPI0015D2950C|nr:MULTISPECIES: HEPN domain-containing protein [Acinetobacter]MCL6241924.1 HEPN domain-containing protein [Acinetobacter amyesii]UUS61267.1 HEPN domain-containing protein [Acinetobacter sp. YH16056_T]